MRRRRMAVSIAEMERVALGGDNSGGGGGLRFSEDIGNVIELGDLGGDMGDDLGLGMIMNQSKVTVNREDSGRTVSINSFAPPAPASSGSGGHGGGLTIDASPLEPLEPIQLDGGDIGGAVDLNSFGGPPVDVHVNRSTYPPSNTAFSGAQSASMSSIHLASPSGNPEQEKKEKSDYINKLARLEQKGFPVSRKFTLDNSLQEIKDEYNRLVDARNLEISIKFQRQMLMGAITGMEWLNGRFDPFDLKLDGWSESVHENVEDFDEIFEELYDKYKDKGKMGPELQLVMKLAGSGFMCHVSNTFFRSKMPSMDDVLRRNPELARQMAAAAAQQAGPGFGNLMGAALGVTPSAGGPPMPPPPMGPMPGVGMSAGMHPSVPAAQTGAFNGASAAPPFMPTTPAPAPTARREMAGPSGVDDILRTFEEVRRAEMTAAAMPQPAAGFAPGPAVAAAMSGAVSVHSQDDIMSHAESTRTGATAQRRRRKAQAPVVGNTISLNV